MTSRTSGPRPKLLLEVLQFALGPTSTNQQKLISRYAQAIGYFAEQGTAPQDLPRAVMEFPGGISGAAAASATRRIGARAENPDPSAAPQTQAIESQTADDLARANAKTHAPAEGTDDVVLSASSARSNQLRRLRESNPEAYLTLLVQVDGAELTLLKSRAVKVNTGRNAKEEVNEDVQDEGGGRRGLKPKSRRRRTR